MKENNGLKKWQAGLGIFGLIVWMLLLQASDYLSKTQWSWAYKLNAGYELGFITAFSGILFRDILLGRWRRHLDDHPIFRWFSYVTIFVILVLGASTFIGQIFGDTSWQFNVGAVVAATVVTLGLAPLLNHLSEN